MKKYLFICLTFALVFSFTSCDSSQSAINDLEVLLQEIETNYQTYTEEDWENMSLSYSAIEEELAKHEYTDEELKEIGRLKGKCMGYLTKQSIKDLEKQIKDLTKELEGGIEGFLEVLSNDNNE
ncbi:MAG: hypothetical protein UHD64_11265 [Bacteroidales bacterium]|jgi:hypothetical protein|nr:hypothetical protein [Bacteroidales bacterium]